MSRSGPEELQAEKLKMWLRLLAGRGAKSNVNGWMAWMAKREVQCMRGRVALLHAMFSPVSSRPSRAPPTTGAALADQPKAAHGSERARRCDAHACCGYRDGTGDTVQRDRSNPGSSGQASEAREPAKPRKPGSPVWPREAMVWPRNPGSQWPRKPGSHWPRKPGSQTKTYPERARFNCRRSATASFGAQPSANVWLLSA